jgi:hypothetical protein
MPSFLKNSLYFIIFLYFARKTIAKLTFDLQGNGWIVFLPRCTSGHIVISLAKSENDGNRIKDRFDDLNGNWNIMVMSIPEFQRFAHKNRTPVISGYDTDAMRTQSEKAISITLSAMNIPRKLTEIIC